MKPVVKYLLVLAFVLVALYGVSAISSDAEAADCTWAQSSGALASTNANWQNGTAPTTGDNVYFTSGSAACTWDITATVNYFGIYSGYSGTITQSSDMNIGARGYWQNGGTFTAITSKSITDSGNFIKNSGTITNYLINLKMSGSIISFNSAVNIFKLQIIQNVVLNSDIYFNSATPQWGIIVDSGKTLTISTGKYIYYAGYANAADLVNNGIITGPGILVFWNYASHSWTLGNTQCPIYFLGMSGIATNVVQTLTTNFNPTVKNIILLQSNDATYTNSLQLAGYSLSCTSLTVGTRGILLGSGSVSCSSNFDSANGTTSDSWSLIMTGTNPYIKTPGGNTINGLTWTGTNLRLASSVNVTKTFYVGGSYTLGSKSVTVGTGTNVTITSGNSWTLTGATRYWGKVNITGTLTSAVPVSVWCNGSSAVNGTVASTIQLHANAFFTFRGTIGTLTIETAYRSHIYANGTWERIVWNKTTAWTLHEAPPNPGDVRSLADVTIISSVGHYLAITRPGSAAFIVDVISWDLVNANYQWTLENQGAPTLYTMTMNIVADAPTMSLYVDNLFAQNVQVDGGVAIIYDTLPSNDETNYLIVSNAFIVPTPDAVDWNTAWVTIGFLVFIVSLIVAFGLVTRNGPAVAFGGLILLIGGILVLSDYGIFTMGMASMAGVFLMLVGAVRD